MVFKDEDAELLVGVARGILRFVENQASDIAQWNFAVLRIRAEMNDFPPLYWGRELYNEMDVPNWLMPAPAIVLVDKYGVPEDVTFFLALRLAVVISLNVQSIPQGIAADLPYRISDCMQTAFHQMMVDRMFEGE